MPATAGIRRRRRGQTGLVLLTAAAVSAAWLAPAAATQATSPATGDTATAATTAAGWLPPTPTAWPLVVDDSTSRPETITRGVTHRTEQVDTVGGRQQADLLSADLSSRNVRLRVVEAGDVLTDPTDETPTSMTTRTGAVAGVNGDYFEIHASGRPLGGVVVDGRLLKSPRPHYNAQVAVLNNGSVRIGAEPFTGTVTVGADSHALSSVNVVNDLAGDAVTELTPDLGVGGTIPAATVVTGRATATGLVVDSVRTGVTTLPALAKGRLALAGSGTGAAWLGDHVHPGDTLAVTDRVGPGDVEQLVSGATQLVDDGHVYTDPTGTPPGGVNPETAIGVSRDGRHLLMVTLDGRAGESVATGVSPAQAAGYLAAHGAWDAVLMDGGGSTAMVARTPGDRAVSVQNTPSDGVERPVANGLFVYSTETAPGPAARVVVHDGAPLTTVVGSTVPLPVYATDRAGNPAATAPSVTVSPAGLASWAAGRLTVHHAGAGTVTATADGVSSTERLTVLDRLTAVTVSPARDDLVNGATQQLSLAGTGPTGAAVTIPAEAARFAVTPAGLGSVDSHGLFTAAGSGVGLVTVTAAVAGARATASIAVGSLRTTVDDLSDPSRYRLRDATGGSASIAPDPGVVPPGSTSGGSTRITYSIPAAPGVHQIVLSPKSTLTVPTAPDGKNPTAVGLWVRGDGSGLELAESYVQVNGAVTTLYPTTVTFHGWQLVVAQLPAGTRFPVRVNFIDFLAISNSSPLSGTLNIADLQALYSPRPVTEPAYVPIPRNPRWLDFTESAASFTPGGATMLTGDDAHLRAADPGSQSAHVLAAVAARLPTLPAVARPDVVQALGDMSDDGAPADLRFARSEITRGIPAHDLVGNHEISQGGVPESQGFVPLFGDTHYAYSLGAATVIATDSAHGGLLASDPFQTPAGAQYPWLVEQLTAARTPVVLVATHMPAYDPHPAANSQFADRWEAREYLRLIQRYVQTHRGVHVAMVYGHARGFSEQVLDPDGNSVDPTHGIPQLTFADLGVPAYAPADRGGFAHAGLVHVGAAGTVQFTVEPALTSIEITAPDQSVVPGTVETLTASGTSIGGDDLAPEQVPIADPASHVWSSSDPRVASVNARTGRLVAHRPGAARISVTSGGVNGQLGVTVAR